MVEGGSTDVLGLGMVHSQMILRVYAEAVIMAERLAEAND